MSFEKCLYHRVHTQKSMARQFRANCSPVIKLTGKIATIDYAIMLDGIALKAIMTLKN